MLILKVSFIIFIFSIATSTIGEYFSYKGYKIYETIPINTQQLDILHKLSAIPQYDFWKLTNIPNEDVHVMVAPTHQKHFENILHSFKFNFSIIDNDISQTIEREKLLHLRSYSINPNQISFEKFLRFEEINAYLDHLGQKFKYHVNVTTVGKSYEKRQIKIIRITNGVHNFTKKSIIIDAGIHAREWIAPATAIFVIHQLVENFEENKYLLEDYDWIVLPVVNPDGYEYSHTTNRMWRKTRSPNKQNLNCSGTDGNRNFGFHWGESGISFDSCSDIYAGSNPFSESETQIVRDLLQAEKNKCKLYITLHSFGRYLLHPWGWTCKLPYTWEDIDNVVRPAAIAMKKATGAKYQVGSSTRLLYKAAGGSDDYAFGVVNIPIAITMELAGDHFIIPTNKIKPYASEAWIGIKTMAKKVMEKY